jgi:hypothetical protein
MLAIGSSHDLQARRRSKTDATPMPLVTNPS